MGGDTNGNMKTLECMKQREACQQKRDAHVNKVADGIRQEITAGFDSLRTLHASSVTTFHDELTAQRLEIKKDMEDGRKSREAVEGRIFDRMEESRVKTDEAIAKVAAGMAGVTGIVKQQAKEHEEDQQAITNRLQQVEATIERPVKWAMRSLLAVLLAALTALAGQWAVEKWGPQKNEVEKKTPVVRNP